jgi:antitoxin PrlF
MPTSTVTSKGQITIPAEVRRELGLHPGSRVDFVRNEDGIYEFRVKTGSVRALEGMFGPQNRVVTLEEMDEAIAEAATS